MMEGHTPVLSLLEEWKLVSSFNSKSLVGPLQSVGNTVKCLNVYVLKGMGQDFHIQ